MSKRVKMKVDRRGIPQTGSRLERNFSRIKNHEAGKTYAISESLYRLWSSMGIIELVEENTIKRDKLWTRK